MLERQTPEPVPAKVVGEESSRGARILLWTTHKGNHYPPIGVCRAEKVDQTKARAGDMLEVKGVA
jgi:hypothetical protein